MWFESSFRSRTVAAMSLCLIGGTSPAAADILQVPGEFPTIQAGIDAAMNGDEVVVADGVYTGEGNRDLDFGGKLITVRSANGPDNCIIDCEGTEFDNHRGFYFHSRESADARVDGLTIRNGWVETGGAGIFIDQSSPTVANCVLEENRVVSVGNGDVFGAGMYNLNANPLVVGCTFFANEIDGPYEEGIGAGAGMANEASSPIVIDCLFLLNGADGSTAVWAGGMSNRNGSQPLIVNCRFIRNYSCGAPGGMSVSNGAATVIGCQFLGNFGEHGAGALGTSNSDSAIINCVFIDESLSNVLGSPVFTNCTMVGLGIVNYDGNLAFTNCVLWNFGIWDDGEASTTVTYSDVSGGFEGEGNINVDPMFVDPDNGDYRLLPGSPCIDAADNTAVPKGIDTDFDGNPRFHDDTGTKDTGNGSPPVVDMGAYEFQGTTVSGACCFSDGSCSVEAESGCIGFGGIYQGDDTDCRPDLCPPPCPWDLDGNGSVGASDLLSLLVSWGPCNDFPCNDCLADFDHNCFVGASDLLALLVNWGPCP